MPDLITLPAYPYVQGVNLQIVDGGQVGGVDGTSCASPIFASTIGMRTRFAARRRR
jgi:hypothetical protein